MSYELASTNRTAPPGRPAAGNTVFRAPRMLLLLALYLLAMLAWVSAKPAFAGEVVVNGEALTDREVAEIAALAGAPVPAGDYWYDPYCGAWGYRGGPCMGFGRAALPIGGPLAPDASGGGTGVFVNGRELHPYDVAALRQCTGAVYPGRYWVDANGYGGLEGGPALFNLAQLCGSRGGGSKSRILNYGSVIAGDGMIGFVDSEGRSFSSGP